MSLSRILVFVAIMMMVGIVFSTQWIEGPTQIADGRIGLSNQEMVCSGDVKVGFTAAHDDLFYSGAVTHVSPWHPIIVSWGAYCEPLNGRQAEPVVASMVSSLFSNGCGIGGGCEIVFTYRNADRVGAVYR